MNLLELLTHAQAHDEDAILYLFQKFKSLILKYAYILEYEDAKSELELFFLELILKMPLKNFGGKDSNFRILAYIKQSMQRHYIYLSKQKSNYQIHNLFLEELPPISLDYLIESNLLKDNQTYVEVLVEKRMLKEILEKAVFSLPKNEKKVIERKFGLFGHTKMTNQEISVDTGIPSNMINYYFKKGVRCISKNASLLSWRKS